MADIQMSSKENTSDFLFKMWNFLKLPTLSI